MAWIRALQLIQLPYHLGFEAVQWVSEVEKVTRVLQLESGVVQLGFEVEFCFVVPVQVAVFQYPV